MPPSGKWKPPPSHSGAAALLRRMWRHDRSVVLFQGCDPATLSRAITAEIVQPGEIELDPALPERARAIAERLNSDCTVPSRLFPLPALSSSVDLVWCQDPNFCQSRWSLLNETARVLRPGGRLVVTAPVVHASVPRDQRVSLELETIDDLARDLSSVGLNECMRKHLHHEAYRSVARSRLTLQSHLQELRATSTTAEFAAAFELLATWRRAISMHRCSWALLVFTRKHEDLPGPVDRQGARTV